MPSLLAVKSTDKEELNANAESQKSLHVKHEIADSAHCKSTEKTAEDLHSAELNSQKTNDLSRSAPKDEKRQIIHR